ncbi:MAG TPA: MMPL family transporter [Solirubrobacteraceae bacterium]|jgi:RND superfamily putative drug exporter|nr:MMPL family transporter [Solirubrobacteraceae bacterium]
MLAQITSLAVRHPRRTAALALLLVLIAAVIGGPVASKLNARNAFEAPASQSARARMQIEGATGVESSAGVIALVHAPPLSAAAASAARTLREDPGVAHVASYAGTREAAVVSKDGRSTLLAASLYSRAEPDAVVDSLTKRLAARHDVQLGGSDVTLRQTNQQASKDLTFAELIALPLLALLALLIFRGAAAFLPLGVGVSSLLGSLVVLRLINVALPLSSFALNVVIGLGLGLSIDYSLILVSRFREELGRGAEIPAAIATTMATAGRTVIFSSLTVAAAMASLLVFPLRFLQSVGVGGAVVALTAAAVSLLLLPALFVLLGGRLGRTKPAPAGQGIWNRLAGAVMRRPGIVATATIAVLLLLAVPTLHTRWNGVDASVLPKSQSAHAVADAISRDFPAANSTPTVIAVSAPPSAKRELAAYGRELARVSGVTSVSAPRRLSSGTWQIDLSANGAPIGASAQRTLNRIRSLPAPYRVAVGGQAAQFHDQQSSIAAALPLGLAILAVSSLLILWLMTGSVILPIKALAMNALTVGAALGLLVLVFQDGRFSGVLAYTGQGGIESTDFLVLAAIVFGLSTDYGVFLLTRIKEGHDRGLSNSEAVAAGLQRTGRVVTAGAIMVAVALGAFATSHVVFIKELGLGTAAAVLIDAFVIRALLVPALMALLGEWNWWSPAPLRRLHAKLGIDEGASAGSSTALAPLPVQTIRVPA